jgi:hypothetical protein
MAAAVAILYQKNGVNFKTTVFGITPSGNYPGDPGEVVTLTSLSANTAAQTVSGPGGTAKLGAAVAASQLGGYKAELKPTATAGQYNLSFWTSGGTELGAGAYPAAISGGVLTVEVDHDMQGY